MVPKASEAIWLVWPISKQRLMSSPFGAWFTQSLTGEPSTLTREAMHASKRNQRVREQLVCRTYVYPRTIEGHL